MPILEMDEIKIMALDEYKKHDLLYHLSYRLLLFEFSEKGRKTN
ncbi:hypothetical protein HMPREF0083_02101 [Aneurinibacillus aneurinilyticus ATCC 12856]|jgi:hypothetical protein|uniref:Uncharacterized protein n=1 Tax=Aneurinibacillus aneurinilyticus ATCC 12856 TaxID=649747 RepID=U1X5M8_ANEAE|nr:hypothetical protein HMPREF0083_02101 [Aneurinibacillus aneurinilyticus ATCC 12856]